MNNSCLIESVIDNCINKLSIFLVVFWVMQKNDHQYEQRTKQYTHGVINLAHDLREKDEHYYGRDNYDLNISLAVLL